MKIFNVFDAVNQGNYEQFNRFYDGNVNAIDKYSKLNLLSLCLVEDSNQEDRIKIIKFLIKEGIDINYIDKKYRRNALHYFYFDVLRPASEYMLEISKILVENGININQLDKYNAIPLNYAISITKKTTQEIQEVYRYLIERGSDYNKKDIFGKSCIDYANEYSWRNDFIKIVEDYQNENK